MNQRARLIHFADELFSLGRDFQKFADKHDDVNIQVTKERYNDLKIKLILEAESQ